MIRRLFSRRALPATHWRSPAPHRIFALVLGAVLLLAACTQPGDPGTSRFRYDSTGRLSASDLSGGGEARYAYDAQGRLTQVAYSGAGALSAFSGRQTLDLSYDDAGNLVAAQSPAGKTSLRYDADARPVEVVDPNGHALRYRYDPWGQVAEVELAQGQATRYEYGIMGQLRQVSAGDLRAEYQYGGDARAVLRRRIGGLTSIFASTASGNVDSITHLDAKGQLICAYTYSYDAMDRVTAVEERSAAVSETTSYEYDVTGRLSRVISPDGSDVVYDYDVMGNRVAETSAAGVKRYAYDGEGRLISAGSATFGYDRAGNLVSRSESGRTTTYAYDAENRLVEVHTPDVKVRHVYDATGNRIRREVNGKPTQYVVDTLMPVPQVVAEQDPGGTSQYLVGASRLAKRLPSGKAVVLLEDRLGSTRCVVDDQGRLLTHYGYTAFGAPSVVEGTPQTDFLFAGEQWEADTGLIYLRNRFYDPKIGRFLSVDPVRGSPWEPASFNQYVYVNNDPANRIDPLGLQYLPPPPPPQFQYRYPSFYEELVAMSTTKDWYRPFASSVAQQGSQTHVTYQSQQVTRQIPWKDQVAFGSRTWGDMTWGVKAIAVFGGLVAGVTGAPAWVGLTCTGVACGAGFLERRDTTGWERRASETKDALSLAHGFRGVLYEGTPFSNVMSPVTRVAGFAALVPPEAWPRVEKEVRKSLGGTHLIDGTRAVFDAGKASVNTAASRIVAGTRESTRLLDPRPVVGAATAASRNLLVEARAAEALGKTLSPGVPGSTPLPTVGQRDDRRNQFMPPPPGGGGVGAGFPKVGGVWLDQTLKLMGDLGTVTGADFDPATGRLTLIGDRSASLPPLKPEYLAAALRAVNLPSDQEPGMTIDPLPQNPRGPVMLVRFFGNTDNTRLGWVMFEADRLMKGYSVGADNVSKQPVESRVPEYRSVTDMRFADAGRGPDLWSRFWLVPEAVTAHVSTDGRTITFDPVRLRVKTETMRWQGGRLVPAGGIKDYHAEAFAEWLTRHYDEVAAEQPVFAELKLVTQTVALAKWLKAQGAPVDWNLIDTVLGEPYPTPTQTPSAFFGKTLTERDDRMIRTFSVAGIGGVEMKPTVAAIRDASVDGLQAGLREAARAAEAKGEPLRSVTVEGRERPVVAVPLVAPHAVGSLGLAESDLAPALRLPDTASSPGLTRYYDSTHNGRSEFGFSWTLRLPRLAIEDLRDEGGIHYLTLPGSKEARVRVQRFTLTNAHGLGEERFNEHFVDQAANRIGFAPSAGRGHFRGLYPEGGNAYRLVFANDDQAVFDLAGRLRAFFYGNAKAFYDYDGAGRLTTIRHLDSKNEERVSFAYDAKGRVESIAASGGRVVYSYDDKGNLSAVKGLGGNIEYRYDERRLLTEVSIDGQLVARNTYDALGRLTAQEDGAGQRVAQEVQQSATGHSITLRDGARWLRQDYDTELRLRGTTDDKGATWHLDYGEGGRPARVEFTSATGQRGKAEFTPDGRALRLSDGRGHNTDYRLSENGLVEEVTRDGKRVASLRRDAQSRVTEVDYGDAGRESLTYDTEGRVLRLARSTGPAATASADHLDMTYDAQGRLARMSSPSGETTEWQWAPDAVTVTRHGASFQVRTDPEGRPLRMRQPDGAAWRFEYDAEGRPRQIFVERGKPVAMARFQEGRLLSIAGPYGDEFKYAYDTAGRVAAATDPAGATAHYEYDAEHRLRLVKLPDGRCVSYTYDKASGRIAEERVARCAS